MKLFKKDKVTENKPKAFKSDNKDGVEISFRNIFKKYEGRAEYTLQDINLTINKKDFCVILGPSGCGKTTLLRMIAGLNSITKGDLIFNDFRVNDLLPNERDIAFVFQSYALYPHMDVYNNMAFSLKMTKVPKNIIDKRVQDAARVLNIDHLLYYKPGELSGGQRQRVALGRAIVRKPSIFLMDEPLSNLDAKLRESMRTELVNIHNILNTTTIYVTHDQLEAMTMATKIILMNEGFIQQIGSPRELYEKPANVFTAKFIGTPTMNIFEGKVVDNKFSNVSKAINIDLSSISKDLLDKINNKEVYVGFRSEDISIHRQKVQNSSPITIYNVELLGKEQEVKTRIEPDGTLVISTSNSEIYKVDEEIHITFNLDRIHLFDKNSKERIN